MITRFNSWMPCDQMGRIEAYRQCTKWKSYCSLYSVSNSVQMKSVIEKKVRWYNGLQMSLKICLFLLIWMKWAWNEQNFHFRFSLYNREKLEQKKRYQLQWKNLIPDYNANNAMNKPYQYMNCKVKYFESLIKIQRRNHFPINEKSKRNASGLLTQIYCSHSSTFLISFSFSKQTISWSRIIISLTVNNS